MSSLNKPLKCSWVVKGSTAASCVDLLVVYGLHHTRRNSLRFGALIAMAGMCSSGGFQLVLKQQEMGGET